MAFVIPGAYYVPSKFKKKKKRTSSKDKETHRYEKKMNIEMKKRRKKERRENGVVTCASWCTTCKYILIIAILRASGNVTADTSA